MHTRQTCASSEADSKRNAQAVRDALELLNGKWKLPLIMVLGDGTSRFNEIQRVIGDITPKTLAKELRDLELNQLVIREVEASRPVVVSYRLTPYCLTLGKVLSELCEWGLQHRQRIMQASVGEAFMAAAP